MMGVGRSRLVDSGDYGRDRSEGWGGPRSLLVAPLAVEAVHEA